MILYLQALKEPLDAFNDEIHVRLRLLKPDEDIITLDSYSEDWLVRSVIEQLKASLKPIIIINRREEALFGSFQPIINQIPMFKQPVIIYAGKSHEQIQKLVSFKNIETHFLNDPQEIDQYLDIN